MQDKHMKSNRGLSKSKAAFNEKRSLFHENIGLDLRKKLMKCCIWSIVRCGAETSENRSQCLESVEICWAKMEISWTDFMKNEHVLHRVEEERNILYSVNRRKANQIGYILRRDCLLKHFSEGKIWGTGRRWKRISSYWMSLRKRKGTGTWKRNYSEGNSVWKGLWFCHKLDCEIDE